LLKKKIFNKLKKKKNKNYSFLFFKKKKKKKIEMILISLLQSHNTLMNMRIIMAIILMKLDLY